MDFSKYSFLTLPFVAGVVLVLGLFLLVVGLQQSTDNRSRAAGEQTSWPKTFVASKNETGPTLTGFVVGAKYKLVVDGVADYDSDATHIKVDPQWGGSTSNPGCFCQPYSEPKLNGKGWSATNKGTAANSAHSYTYIWTADKTSLQFSVADSNYTDNTGGWNVTVTLDSLPPPPGCKVDSDCTAPQVCEVATGKCVAPPPAGSTIFNFELFLHGIGKSGDNRNPSGGGNQNPLHNPRPVTVEVHNPADGATVVSKDTQASYDSGSGSYKISNLDMGTTLVTKTYQIKVITQSLRGTVTRDITSGIVNAIPAMSLTNGDATWDGKLDVEDYNMIQGCVRDFDLPPVDCDSIREAKADLDDDGTVGLFDVNLFIRELSVQQL